MLTRLGRGAAALSAAVMCVLVAAPAVQAGTEPTTPTTPPPTTPAPTPPANVADTPSSTPDRGSMFQATETLPAPSTTTTLPPDVLPANSGTGRRMVYSKTAQRTWAVEADGTVAKTHLVSGRRTWNQPSPGVYEVFSRSGFTCNIKNPDICWRYMVRFTVGPDGDNIGFHEIPKKNGVPVQTEAQLGQPLSNGCIRQATPDALWVWNWTPVGTKVVVLP